MTIRRVPTLFQLATAVSLVVLCLPLSARADTVILELSRPTHALEAVIEFERTALSLRNATDEAFLVVKSTMAHAEDSENATAAVQDAISGFYFAVTSASLNATQALPIPEGLSEEVASLLYEARQTLLQSLQDRLSLAAALVAGTEHAEGAAELARAYAMQTGSHDFYLNILLQDARDAAAP
ncbi:hypothetical protein [Megalodesulfovibrio paquesii]